MRWFISRIRLNRQGYARGGQYFGAGPAVFTAETDEWTAEFWATCAILARKPWAEGAASDLSRYGEITFRAADVMSARKLIRTIDQSATFTNHGKKCAK